MLPAVLSESKEPDLPVIAKKNETVSHSMKVVGKKKKEKKKRQKGS